MCQIISVNNRDCIPTIRAYKRDQFISMYNLSHSYLAAIECNLGGRVWVVRTCSGRLLVSAIHVQLQRTKSQNKKVDLAHWSRTGQQRSLPLDPRAFPSQKPFGVSTTYLALNIYLQKFRSLKYVIGNLSHPAQSK